MMAETQSLLRVTGHGMTAYMLLHENPEGKAGKVWLTIEAVGPVK
jgi:NADPH-dependent curcumin reductase CurA